jgi:hypothetical protein
MRAPRQQALCWNACAISMCTYVCVVGTAKSGVCVCVCVCARARAQAQRAASHERARASLTLRPRGRQQRRLARATPLVIRQRRGVQVVALAPAHSRGQRARQHDSTQHDGICMQRQLRARTHMRCDHSSSAARVASTRAPRAAWPGSSGARSPDGARGMPRTIAAASIAAHASSSDSAAASPSVSPSGCSAAASASARPCSARALHASDAVTMASRRAREASFAAAPVASGGRRVCSEGSASTATAAASCAGGAL